MISTILILPDQVARNNSALAEALDPPPGTERSQVLLIESTDLLDLSCLSKSDLVLCLSALRHFEMELHRRKLTVDFRSGSVLDALRQHISVFDPGEIVVMEPLSPARLATLKCLLSKGTIPFRVTANSMCVSDRRMPDGRPVAFDFFYRSLRSHLNILMDNGKPFEGIWSPLAGEATLIEPFRPCEGMKFPPDEVTEEAIRFVEREFPDLPGSTEGFARPVTHAQANDLIDHLIQNGRLEAHSYSLIEPFLDIGLLNPHHLVKKAETGYKTGKLTLRAAEGFIREVLGRREFLYLTGWINDIRASTPKGD